MLEWIEKIATTYPYAAAISLWSLWMLGALWEYRINRRRHLLGAQLVALFGALAFWFSMLEGLGELRWLLVIGAALVGVFWVRYLRKQPDRDADFKDRADSKRTV